MTLTQLQYIVAVAETNSFYKAADRCHVTQPTLSQQIKKLEEDLGVLIFDRSTKPITLTVPGEAILAQARRVLSEGDILKGLVSEGQTASLQGELKLAIIPTLAPFILPKLVRELHQKYPKLTLQIEEMQTEVIVQKLNSAELDLGILVTPLSDPRLTETPVFYEPFYLYFSLGHAIGAKKTVSAKDLNRHEIHLLADGHCFRVQALELCRNQRKLKAQSSEYLNFASGSLQTLKEMVDVVGGYTLLPWLACHEFLSPRDRERIRSFEKPTPVREVSVVSRAHELKVRAVPTVVEAIRRTLPKKLLEDGASDNVVPVIEEANHGKK